MFLLLLTKFNATLIDNCDSTINFSFDDFLPWNGKLVLGSGGFGTVFKYYVAKMK